MYKMLSSRVIFLIFVKKKKDFKYDFNNPLIPIIVLNCNKLNEIPLNNLPHGGI